MRQDVARDVVVARPEEPVSVVVARMAEAGVRHFGIALITDSAGKLLGVFNNGDVLRLIARGGDMTAPIGSVMVEEPVVVREGLTDAEILQDVARRLMARTGGRKRITQFVPVLDDTNRVVDVIDTFELLSRAPRQGETVAVYGLGFVGLTLAAVLSAHGHRVTGIDTSPTIIEGLGRGEFHVHEPRLPEMVRQGVNDGTLSFSVEPGSDHHRVVIVAVGTPVSETGDASMSAVRSVCEVVGPRLRRGDLVMLRSTVPVGTTRDFVIPLLEDLSGLRAGAQFNVAFCPERTVEGQAIRELSALPQIVGGFSDTCAEKAAGFWATLTDAVVRVDSLEAAELVKLANNSYRDLSFSFANALALLADRYNLDATRLISAANEGYPRNPIPKPSPGVGGYCLTKDPYLYGAIDPDGLHSRLSRLGRQINGVAGRYPLRVLERFAERLGRSVADLRVLVVGIAFKGQPETNDVRGSTGADAARQIAAAGARTSCFDAVIGSEGLESQGFTPANLLEEAGRTDAVLILNNHPDNAPDGLLERLSSRPSLLFDGWGLFDAQEVEKYTGLVYATLGYMTPPRKDRSTAS